MIHKPKAAWQVNIPNVPQGVFNFSFTVNLPPGLFGFTFEWFNDVWNVWVTLPTGEIRQAGSYPNEINWTGFIDYYLSFVTTLKAIGQNDLPNAALMVYQR